MKEGLIISKKNNFLSKLFLRIKNIFGKTNVQNIELAQESKFNIENIKNNVMDSIKVSDSYKELLDLQRKIETEEISIADISEEMAERLIELYEKQSV